MLPAALQALVAGTYVLSHVPASAPLDDIALRLETYAARLYRAPSAQEVHSLSRLRVHASRLPTPPQCDENRPNGMKALSKVPKATTR